MSDYLNLKLIQTVCTEVIGDVPAQLTFNGVAVKIEDIKEGFLYIPFTDEEMNRGDVLGEAVQSGASSLLVEKRSIGSVPKDTPIPVFFTENIEKAVQQMAKLVVEEIDPTVIAITGDQAAITADLTSAVLSKSYHVTKSVPGQSDWLGNCITVLNMDPSTEMLIVEYGLNISGELAELSQIIEPNIAMITVASWELPFPMNDRSKEAVVEEYGMIEMGMKASALLLVDGDEPAVINHQWKTDVVFCGTSENCVFQLVEMEEEGDSLHFQLKGIHMPFKVKKSIQPYMKNAVFAIGVAVHLGILPDDMMPGLKQFDIKNNH